MNHDDFKQGQASAKREIKAGHWTGETARAYLEQCRALGCAEGRDDYDRGFMSVVEALAAQVAA